jgi:hypothetical protein
MTYWRKLLVDHPGKSPSCKGEWMLDSVVEVVLAVAARVRQSMEVML